MMISRCTSPLVRSFRNRAALALAGSSASVDAATTNTAPLPPRCYSPALPLAHSTAPPPLVTFTIGGEAPVQSPSLLLHPPYVAAPLFVSAKRVFPRSLHSSFSCVGVANGSDKTATTAIDWFDDPPPLQDDMDHFIISDDVCDFLDDILAVEDFGLTLLEEEDLLLAQTATTKNNVDTVAVSKVNFDTDKDKVVQAQDMIPSLLIPSEEILRAADQVDSENGASAWEAADVVDLLDEH